LIAGRPACHLNGRDGSRNCGYLCACQILAGRIPQDARHEPLLIRRRVEDLKPGTAAHEKTLQPVLAVEVYHIARGNRLNFRRRYLDRRTGYRGLTIRRNVEQHELVTVSGGDCMQAVRWAEIRDCTSRRRHVLNKG
jgi:hypothetical protein